ncbi:MAG: pantetheine-phosphate adenylyltransferase [Aeromonadales bacterium]|nr:pantetheine-phosphate adenylyltransferase [Aeromonadales bacterium]MDY2891381.1 pantetheine-phosphate adenylyltransferase [Succinivibrio sp.]
MNNSPAVFPGTFDPLTLGHLDIIRRAARVFGRVIVAVAASPAKHPLLTLEERVETARRSVQDLGCVEVKGFSGMLVDFLRQEGASVLVRGVRTVADYDYEVQLSGMYRVLMPDMEIVMLPTSGDLCFISSTLVRDVIIHDGDISKFVPGPVEEFVKAHPHFWQRGQK